MTTNATRPTRQDGSSASGLVNTSTQVGGASGLAVLPTRETERTAGRDHRDLPPHTETNRRTGR